MERHPVQHFWVPGRVPSYTELVAARTGLGSAVGRSGKRWSGYSDIKRDYQHKVVLCARSQRILPVDAVYCTYLFFEEDKRRDPFNFVGGGIKLIEDGLRKAEVLPNDGWKNILGFAAYWDVDRDRPGVATFLSKHGTLDRQTAVYNDSIARKLDGARS